MYRMHIITAVVIVLAPSGIGQAPALDRAMLLNDPDAVIELVVRNSPEIKRAEAEVAAAKANLESVRASLSMKIAGMNQELLLLNRELERIQNRYTDGNPSVKRESAPILFKLNQLETRLRLMSGGNIRPEATEGVAEDRPADQNTLSMQARPALKEFLSEDSFKKLETELFNFDFRGMALENVMPLLSAKFAPDTPAAVDMALRSAPITINLQEISCLDAFAAIADQADACIVFRPYGIFVTSANRARTIPGPTIPEGVPYWSAERTIDGEPDTPRFEKRPTLEEGAGADLRELLDSMVSISFEDATVMEVLGFIQDTYDGISLTVAQDLKDMVIGYVKLQNVRLEDALVAVLRPLGLCAVVEEYGLFITTRKEAEMVAGATIPGGVPYLVTEGVAE